MLLFLAFLALFIVQPAFAVTFGDDVTFEGPVTAKNNPITYSEIAAPGTPATGDWYIYFTSAGLFVKDDAGSATQITAGAGDNTLDNAYDQGGAGSGKKVNADSGAVELEVADESNNGALLLDMDDSTNNPDVLTITNAGSGADIVAPGFSLTAGAIVGTTTALSGNMTLDDGVGASPSLTLTDATNESAIFSKADSGVLSLTTEAADGFNILGGNLTVGNGSPGHANLGGEDAYIEGELEVDATAYFDGDITGDGASILSGVLFDTETVTATNVITAAECGSTFYLNSATEFASTLPAISTVSAGCQFKFVTKAAASGADYTILTGNSLENLIYGTVDVNSATVACADEDTLTLVTGNAVGDWVALESDGDVWYVTGRAVTAAKLTCTQAD